ncbi:hypothetical protein PROFUN_09712 [Planoprotostelium fungivorum]|uniref:WWE domain-containing protein n=1 Tax=Planoprotostelium fungivorum TaxID=1890364 RepID=A0A2P6NEW7_9EUKA|nr:hypothetical protein PROFUN_09712 [Planoprotostelium fungivorum]
MVELMKTASGRIVSQKEIRSRRPAYRKLLVRALKELNKDGDPEHATSIPAVIKWISMQYEVKNIKMAGQCIWRAAQKAVEENKLKQVRRSFILCNKKRNQRETKRRTARRSKRREDHPRSIESPVVEKSLEPEKLPRVKGLKHDHMWQFETRNYGWVDYQPDASDTVEDVYQDYLSNRGHTDVRAVRSGRWEYLVDFLAMKQTNIHHDSHTIRNIRRIPVHKD